MVEDPIVVSLETTRLPNKEDAFLQCTMYTCPLEEGTTVLYVPKLINPVLTADLDVTRELRIEQLDMKPDRGFNVTYCIDEYARSSSIEMSSEFWVEHLSLDEARDLVERLNKAISVYEDVRRIEKAHDDGLPRTEEDQEKLNKAMEFRRANRARYLFRESVRGDTKRSE